MIRNTHSVEANHEKDHRTCTTIHYNRKALILKYEELPKKAVDSVTLRMLHKIKLQKPNLELSTDTHFY